MFGSTLVDRITNARATSALKAMHDTKLKEKSAFTRMIEFPKKNIESSDKNSFQRFCSDHSTATLTILVIACVLAACVLGWVMKRLLGKVGEARAGNAEFKNVVKNVSDIETSEVSASNVNKEQIDEDE